MVLRLERLRLPLWRQQAVWVHQPQHAAYRGAHLAHPQPSPHPPVAFAMGGRFLDGARDFVQEVLIALASLRAAPGRRRQAERLPAPLVEGRPWQAPMP
jgi:hypothetical protein